MSSRLIGLLLTTFLAQPVFAGQFPATEMDSLAGETRHFPEDFTGKPTLVIFAFAHEQRDDVQRVMKLLQEAQNANSGLVWYELPIIDAPGIAHYFIKNGMRDGTDEALHAHMVPQFVDEDAWHTATGIAAKDPLLAKVDHIGAILKTAPLASIKTAVDVKGF